MLSPLIKNAPVIGSCYGFATTASILSPYLSYQRALNWT